jgi:hypothetical protein
MQHLGWSTSSSSPATPPVTTRSRTSSSSTCGFAVRIDKQLNTGGLSGVAVGVAAVAAHGMCPAVPGCAWVYLLCASLSALAALMCLSPGQQPTRSLKGVVVCRRPPRTSLCGKPRRTSMSAGRNHMCLRCFYRPRDAHASYGHGRADRERSARVTEHNNWISLVAHNTMTCPPMRCFCTTSTNQQGHRTLLHGASLMPPKTSKGAQREKSRAHQPAESAESDQDALFGSTVP